jgi:hypothetical protein
MDSSQITWRKSSRSADEGQCVEVGLWRTPTVGVEQLRHVPEAPALDSPATPALDEPENRYVLRDSKDLDGPVLILTPNDWTAFLRLLKQAE